MDRANFIYPVIVWLTFGLFSLLGYHESCCYKYLCTNLCVDVMFSILLRILVDVELLGQMVILCLTFLAVVTLFFKLAAPFYIPTSSVWGLQFSHNLTNTSFSCLNCTFIYLFLAVLVLCCCMGFSLVSASSVRASHCVGFSCYRALALGLAGFSNCITWAQWLLLPGSRAQAQ